VRDSVLSTVTPDTIAVVLDAETIPAIDVTGATMLIALRARLSERDIRLLVAKSIGQVRDVVTTAEPGADVPGRYDTVDAAVAAARTRATGQADHPPRTSPDRQEDA
jgi:hypothetical protein